MSNIVFKVSEEGFSKGKVSLPQFDFVVKYMAKSKELVMLHIKKTDESTYEGELIKESIPCIKLAGFTFEAIDDMPIGTETIIGISSEKLLVVLLSEINCTIKVNDNSVRVSTSYSNVTVPFSESAANVLAMYSDVTDENGLFAEAKSASVNAEFEVTKGSELYQHLQTSTCGSVNLDMAIDEKCLTVVDPASFIITYPGSWLKLNAKGIYDRDTIVLNQFISSITAECSSFFEKVVLKYLDTKKLSIGCVTTDGNEVMTLISSDFQLAAVGVPTMEEVEELTPDEGITNEAKLSDVLNKVEKAINTAQALSAADKEYLFNIVTTETGFGLKYSPDPNSVKLGLNADIVVKIGTEEDIEDTAPATQFAVSFPLKLFKLLGKKYSEEAMFKLCYDNDNDKCVSLKLEDESFMDTLLLGKSL